ncbi:MAG TPA: ATP-binding cassette domain-containing protein [Bacteriovoracaceae bacterium]|nr:ATP-binding cassette domain-containing protein [Bacteriovoracaceae bacterium]
MEILTLKNIHKAFGEKKVHQGVSFSLHSGETIGLLGNSGTGKSVLLRSIIGLERIDAGEIYYRSQRLDILDEEAYYPIRKKISYSFQNSALFDSLNVFDNIAYPLFEHTSLTEEEIHKKVDDILNLIDLPHAKYLMPSDLSGGMQKRVGLARSMILTPEILLYDEPTAGLDPVNTDIVIDIMNEFKKRGFSGIFVTHDIPAAKRVCDRILILRDGKIYFNGTKQEFIDSTDPFVNTFGSNNKGPL